MSETHSEKLADFPTRHYGAGYKGKIPPHLNRFVPTGIYHFEVHPSYSANQENKKPLRSLSVKADSSAFARKEALKVTQLGPWERLALHSVEPNPEHVELMKALSFID